MKKDTLLISLYAGPGAGKTTLAAGLFYKLKLLNCIGVEYLPEPHKCLTYSKSSSALNWEWLTKLYQENLNSLIGNVDVVVTDSPPEFFDFYSKGMLKIDTPAVDRLNVYVNRTKEYRVAGRWHTENEAHEIDKQVRSITEFPLEVSGDALGLEVLYKYVVEKCKL